jgi:hypothetical protein
MWQQLVLPVVSYGSEIWGPQYLHFMEPLYYRDNPGEQVHLQFLRWYTGARRQTHTQVILKAGNRLPLMQHWLRRALQLWNKLSTADPDSWLAHAAFLSNIQLWQSGCNTCWTARLMAHMQQLGLLNDPGSQQQPPWSQQFDPDSIEVAMDAIMTAAWDSYQHRPYRQLGETHCEGRTLFCYAQYFIGLSNSTARRHVYHNIPASAWGPIMQLATGRLRLRCVTAHWHGHERSHSSCCPRCPGELEDPAHYVLECPAYNAIRQEYAHIKQAASAVAHDGDVSQAMRQLFVPDNAQEIAAFLRRAYRIRFSEHRTADAHQVLAEPVGGRSGDSMALINSSTGDGDATRADTDAGSDSGTDSDDDWDDD